MITGVDDDIAFGLGLPKADKERLICFFIDDAVVIRRFSKTVRPHLKGTPIVIHNQVEKRRIVPAPNGGAERLLNDVVQNLTGHQVFNLDGKAF